MGPAGEDLHDLDKLVQRGARTPNAARMYNYLLGGKDNYTVDRKAVEHLLTAWPDARPWAADNRAFLERAVTFVAEAGVRQFVDIGAGLPTAQNTHDVARAVAPGAKTLYVDVDPVAVSHARALLPRDQGLGVFRADLRDTHQIIEHMTSDGLIDTSAPVAIVLNAVLHFVSDADDPYRAVSSLMDAVPAGSYLVISHATADEARPAEVWRLTAYAGSSAGLRMRSRSAVEAFFDGLELVEPGVVGIAEWRDSPQQGRPRVMSYGGVGRKP